MGDQIEYKLRVTKEGSGNCLQTYTFEPPDIVRTVSPAGESITVAFAGPFDGQPLRQMIISNGAYSNAQTGHEVADNSFGSDGGQHVFMRGSVVSVVPQSNIKWQPTLAIRASSGSLAELFVPFSVSTRPSTTDQNSRLYLSSWAIRVISTATLCPSCETR